MFDGGRAETFRVRAQAVAGLRSTCNFKLVPYMKALRFEGRIWTIDGSAEAQLLRREQGKRDEQLGTRQKKKFINGVDYKLRADCANPHECRISQ